MLTALSLLTQLVPGSIPGFDFVNYAFTLYIYIYIYVFIYFCEFKNMSFHSFVNRIKHVFFHSLLNVSNKDKSLAHAAISGITNCDH